MPNKFTIWVDDANVDSATQTQTEFASDNQRSQGFKQGNAISSIRVNTALRQANLITCALMNIVAPNDDTVDFRSSVADAQALLNTYFSSLGRTITLNGAVNTAPTFYAPTSAGTAGRFLMSNGANKAPTFEKSIKIEKVTISSQGTNAANYKVVLNDSLANIFPKKTKITLRCWIDNDSGVNNYQIFDGVVLPQSSSNKCYFNFQVSGGSLLNDTFEYPQFYEIRGVGDYTDNQQINFTCKKVTFHKYTDDAYQVEDVSLKLQVESILKYVIEGEE